MELAMPARIMIVEDDYHLALLLQYNLEAAGFEVEHVESGDDAERRIAEKIPDLVLVDWMLPGISGIELCRRIRRQASTRALPIMMLTARTGTDDREFAVNMGATAFMSKPFSLSEVLARARRLLASPPGETLATT
jgi:two-component system, OmpR family, phosphate regulon response regulator PhoB